MKHNYLEVTFRRGKALAAYLYLPRESGSKAARTSDEGHGLHVDFDANEKPMGIEITAPSVTSVAQVNEVLARLGVAALRDDEWAPLKAA